jgi:hypothetical protein
MGKSRLWAYLCMFYLCDLKNSNQYSVTYLYVYENPCLRDPNVKNDFMRRLRDSRNPKLKE